MNEKAGTSFVYFVSRSLLDRNLGQMIQELEALKIIPVVAIHDADHAAPLAEALVAGGLPVAEVTLRTDAGLDAIAKTPKTTPSTTATRPTIVGRSPSTRKRG